MSVENNSSIRIVIGGDVCPIGRNEALFETGDAQGIFTDLLDEFVAADLAIVNLECPLIGQESPILKSGPVLGVSSDAVRGLKNSHIDVVNLANNHILDHGEQGMKSTKRVCHEAGMKVVGAGDNLADAREILSLQVEDVRVGILAFAEHEFSIAKKDKPGANPLDPIEFVRQMRRHREELDYVVVLLHGGKEHYPYPSPRLQQTCRFMVEEGANAVICQHSHCPGCYEDYANGHIVYGQGNLIFDLNGKQDETWFKGYLVTLSIESDCTSKINIVPYTQSDRRVGARKMERCEEDTFRRDLQQKSALIKDSKFVEKQWKQFCESNKYLYFSYLRGHNRVWRYLNRKFHFSDAFYSKRSLAALQNIIRCEAHRELLETILSDIPKKVPGR